MPASLDRRQIMGLSCRTLLAASLVGTVQRLALGATTGHRSMSLWLDQLGRCSERLGQGKSSGLQWQEAMDKLYGSVSLSELVRYVDFSKLRTDLLGRDLGARGEVFQDIDIGLGTPVRKPGEPEPSRQLITKIAHIRKGRSVPPHGHSNMVSAFLCVSGTFHVRLFDRLEDRPREMIVRQTVDQPLAGPGSWSSISDYRNNVHWLVAKSDDCFLFTCKLIRIEDDRAFQGRINVDVQAGRELGARTLKAPKITGRQAAEKY